MKNAKNVRTYWQVDHKIKNIFEPEGVIVLPSLKAWEKLKWTRKFFEKKPKEGYFIWVKKQVDFPLATCITIASPKISQNLRNLLVIEKGIKAKANVICNATKNFLCAKHFAKGKIILKKGVFLEYNHLHHWGKKDVVSPDYEFILEENCRLHYNYKNIFPPKNLNLKTFFYCYQNSSVNLNFVINSLNSEIGILDNVHLLGKSSQAIVRLRLVGRKNSNISAISQIYAISPSRGHLDCQGLLIDKRAKISLSPKLVCENKKAQLTHEASIGKISEEELNYLRMRGLSESQAIDLIVNGFLKLT